MHSADFFLATQINLGEPDICSPSGQAHFNESLQDLFIAIDIAMAEIKPGYAGIAEADSREPVCQTP